MQKPPLNVQGRFRLQPTRQTIGQVPDKPLPHVERSKPYVRCLLCLQTTPCVEEIKQRVSRILRCCMDCFDLSGHIWDLCPRASVLSRSRTSPATSAGARNKLRGAVSMCVFVCVCVCARARSHLCMRSCGRARVGARVSKFVGARVRVSHAWVSGPACARVGVCSCRMCACVACAPVRVCARVAYVSRASLRVWGCARVGVGACV